MDFQQIRDFVNPAVAQATGLQEVGNLSMPVPAAFLANGNGGGGSITVDSELSATSTNPVENRVITAALDTLGIDQIVRLETEGNPFTGVHLNKTYAEIESIIFDDYKIPILFDNAKCYVYTSKFYSESDQKNYICFVAPLELSSFTLAVIPVTLLSEDDTLIRKSYQFAITVSN